jgi:exodeoxyribonuclease V
LKKPEFKNLLCDQIGSFIPAQQAELIDILIDFLFQRQTKSVFILKGFAGTGKTTVLGALVRAFDSFKGKTVLLAPTGRAAKVLSTRANKTASTIHRKIYQTQKVNGSLQVGLAPNLHTNTLFVIDEASMISDYSMNADGSNARNLLEDVMEYVFMGEGCKLIFLGDIGQLPPVGSDESPALDIKYMKYHYPQCYISSFQLTEVIRQASDSDILYNATKLRNELGGSYPKLKLNGRSDLVRVQGMELMETIEQSYDSVGKENTIIITRSNKQANQYNQQVRNRILWMEEEVSSGELMMVVANNYFWLGEENRSIGFIANGEMIRVKRVLKAEEIYGFRFLNVSIQLTDHEDIEPIDVLIVLETLTSETPNLSRQRQKELFFEIEKDFEYIHNKKQRYQKIMESPYFNALQVKYGYAITCHKSQGGQWAHVFLDQGYLTEEMIDKSFLRWLYTGVTRASEQLHLVNFNDLFFEEN